VAFLCVGAGSRAACRSSLVQRRWSIFHGFDLPGVNAKPLNPDDVGTRSQREVDGSGRRVECSLPLGVEFEERDGGDIYIKSVEHGTDAWEHGVRPGAHLTMVSATFGDEMWTTRKVGMSQFMTVLNSRFGATISLALEQEDQRVLQTIYAAETHRQHKAKEDRKREASMAGAFEREEAKLQNKGMWNLLR